MARAPHSLVSLRIFALERAQQSCCRAGALRWELVRRMGQSIVRQALCKRCLSPYGNNLVIE